MRNKRRDFIHKSLIGASLLTPLSCRQQDAEPDSVASLGVGKPVVVSTWNFGQEANVEAWKVLADNGRALDAVEKGVMVTEADPTNQSVGLGGFPDRDGRVTLDACIMDETGNCGSVAAIEHIVHPISVARKVMEESPHVMIVGQGALEFAISQGFEKTNLLTPESEEAWIKWQEKSEYKPIINIENHDTIGMLALDHLGNLAGACTTSGLAYKMRGRVGDSPIIGAGLYVDNEIGGAVATGLGEEVIKVVGAHLVVELMRQGRTPDEACQAAVERIAKKHRGKDLDFQIAMLALRKDGLYGGYAIHDGFTYAVKNGQLDKVIPSKNLL